VTDSTSQLRTATRRAKSDVANKLVSMFLHELSRRVSQSWPTRIEGDAYAEAVRRCFGNRCPYCLCELAPAQCVIEHLDGMNRYRAGLHVTGNVLVACKRCNSEKRRDDSLRELRLAGSGWASFLSHDGQNCPNSCQTCSYWRSIWPDQGERSGKLEENRNRIARFREQFPEAEHFRAAVSDALPSLLTKLYVDCQEFAENEIGQLLRRFDEVSNPGTASAHQSRPSPGLETTPTSSSAPA